MCQEGIKLLYNKLGMNILSEISEITPTRNLNLLYIILDSTFVIFFLILLILKKRYLTLSFSIFGGILYFIVDYCGFYLLAHSRSIYINNNLCNNEMTALILLWMSLSYGITNFAFIWLCLSKDKYLKYWLFLIISWWMICPTISTLGGANNIKTMRTTGEYHGIMGIVLILSYFILIVILMFKKENLVSILKLNLIGISVQFSWEIALLINGIRPLNSVSFQTLIINSLMETNLGMPLIFGIFYVVTSYFNEDFTYKTMLINNDSEN